LSSIGNGLLTRSLVITLALVFLLATRLPSSYAESLAHTVTAYGNTWVTLFVLAVVALNMLNVHSRAPKVIQIQLAVEVS